MSCGPLHWMFQCNRRRLSLLTGWRKREVVVLIWTRRWPTARKSKWQRSATASREKFVAANNLRGGDRCCTETGLPHCYVLPGHAATNQLASDCRSKIANACTWPISRRRWKASGKVPVWSCEWRLQYATQPRHFSYLGSGGAEA